MITCLTRPLFTSMRSKKVPLPVACRAAKGFTGRGANSNGGPGGMIWSCADEGTSVATTMTATRSRSFKWLIALTRHKLSHGSGERKVAAPGSTLATLDIQENDAV